jgi:hypothetical protein
MAAEEAMPERGGGGDGDSDGRSFADEAQVTSEPPRQRERRHPEAQQEAEAARGVRVVAGLRAAPQGASGAALPSEWSSPEGGGYGSAARMGVVAAEEGEDGEGAGGATGGRSSSTERGWGGGAGDDLRGGVSGAGRGWSGSETGWGGALTDEEEVEGQLHEGFHAGGQGEGEGKEDEGEAEAFNLRLREASRGDRRSREQMGLEEDRLRNLGFDTDDSSE